jgi:KUP system potassium uptake protein
VGRAGNGAGARAARFFRRQEAARMTSEPSSSKGADTALRALAVGALGVVYGDIGTSPLYTIRECFSAATGIAATPENVLGILSLIFWSLVGVITLKYVVLLMRADNRGEGGVLALMSLATRGETGQRAAKLVVLGLIGAALFYGDSVLTPAISVLSAIEGLSVATDAFDHAIVPLTLLVLVALFLVQRFGTARVGAAFGPVMGVWFALLFVLGAIQIARNPVVLLAVDPRHAVTFFAQHGFVGFSSLGAVVLAITGAEALYADMGHFGPKAIRWAWTTAVLPALVINYFGQGALILAEPEALANPFYKLAPAWGLYPMVALATIATIIASQAVISGAFSMTRQAAQLGLTPRIDVRHTSAQEMGQIYVPTVNWLLLIGVVQLVVTFRSSSNLAAAYGIAVTGTMTITTALVFVLARDAWGWSLPKALLLIGPFAVIDVAFLSSNLLKVETGGYVPLVIGAAIFAVMWSWRRGRSTLLAQERSGAIPIELFLARLGREGGPERVAGTAVFMTGLQSEMPHTLLHNLKHNRVLHERVLLTTVVTRDEPYVPDAERIAVADLGHGFHRVTVTYGFMQDPDVPGALALARIDGAPLEMMAVSFFVGRNNIVAAEHCSLPRWQEKLFIRLSRMSSGAASFFRIPPNKVVELGARITI